jgi:hypothetical protein
MGRRTKRRIPHLGDWERRAHQSQVGCSSTSRAQVSPSVEDGATGHDRAWLGLKLAGSVDITIISRASEPIPECLLEDLRLIKLGSLSCTLCGSNLHYLREAADGWVSSDVQ